MKTLTTAASLALSFGLVNGQVRFCDANRRPNWDDCRALVEDFGMQGSPEIAHINGELDPAPSCMHWWWNDGNCLLTHCYQEEPTESPDGEPRSLTLGQVYDLYDPIRSRCSPLRAGGEFTGAFEFVNVFNDEDRAGGSGEAAKREVEMRSLFKGLKSKDGITKGSSTLEDYIQWRNDTASDEERMASSFLERRDAVIGSDAPIKRDDDDDYFQIHFEALGIRHPDLFDRGPRLSSGVGYTWDVSESQTYSVTTSASMGASWDIFSASVGIETSQSETYTVAEGISFNVDCPNQAQITFYPLYDYYEITAFPSETHYEIWSPVISQDRRVNGEVAAACLG